MKYLVFLLSTIAMLSCKAQQYVAECCNTQPIDTTYLSDIKKELVKQWPNNRIINLVFHGHSVPTGYALGADVKPFESYPQLVFRELKKLYPSAVINIILTSKGGEFSPSGAKRFDADVLPHRPDVLFIDYGVNDKHLKLTDTRAAMDEMIKKALQKNIKVILLTSTPDLRVNILQPGNEIEMVSDQIKQLAAENHVGCADVYNAFKKYASEGNKLSALVYGFNHFNEKGSTIIANQIMPYFK
ncbi:SGNH/GDSL hydrolase family protein [Mucilaginibacter hurinus]|nr:SGNH/GDSL hydrolase family protein [Mucilaginibacter hurinus]